MSTFGKYHCMLYGISAIFWLALSLDQSSKRQIKRDMKEMMMNKQDEEKETSLPPSFH